MTDDDRGVPYKWLEQVRLTVVEPRIAPVERSVEQIRSDKIISEAVFRASQVALEKKLDTMTYALVAILGGVITQIVLAAFNTYVKLHP